MRINLALGYIFLLFFLGICRASGLQAIRTDDGIVFTNVATREIFFVRAFKYSHLSKKSVMRMVVKISERYGVDPKLVKAIATIESDFDSDSISKRGAKGVMQLVNATARSYGVDDPYNARQNITGGVLFIKHLIKKYRNLRLVIAAYNAGETAIDKYKGVPPFSETKRYVEKVLAIYKREGGTFLSHHRGRCSIRKVDGVFTNLERGLW